jgi:hypothetical protein
VVSFPLRVLLRRKPLIRIFDHASPVEQRLLSKPVAVVLVDAEEDFDWLAAFSRSNTSVQSIKNQWLAHRVFDRYQIRPTYLVDFPIAVSSEGVAVLRDLLASGQCEIGTQLHPWVTPPFDEEINERNSYAGNLPPELERAKLTRLTRVIQDRFGIAPVVYRAGRYGLGPSTSQVLHDLGYQVDTSVWPFEDLRRFGGPNYAGSTAGPMWVGPNRSILELPVTRGFVGLLRRSAPSFFPYLANAIGERMKLGGIARRLRLAELITLSPEGGTHGERVALTQTLLEQGQRIFTFSYHSSSLVPGNTPFVRNQADLDAFIRDCEDFFSFFVRLGGEFISATALRARLAQGATAGDAQDAAESRAEIVPRSHAR